MTVVFSNPRVLKNYSSVLVNFALNSGKGVSKGEVVYLQFDLPALPLAREVYKRVLENDAFPMVKILEQSFSKIYYEKANTNQLRYFPKKYTKSLVDTIDHRVYLMAPEDPFYLKDINPKKLMIANESNKLYRKWLQEKEDKGKLTWTLALYPTLGMAKEALLSEDEFAAQIEKACFLNEPEPLLKWKKVFVQIEAIRDKLSKLPIKNINIKAKNTNLNIGLGKKRKWKIGRAHV
jgi:aminopeptidase